MMRRGDIEGESPTRTARVGSSWRA